MRSPGCSPSKTTMLSPVTEPVFTGRRSTFPSGPMTHATSPAVFSLTIAVIGTKIWPPKILARRYVRVTMPVMPGSKFTPDGGLHADADRECLRNRVCSLRDLFDMDWKLESGCRVEAREHLHDVGRAQVGGHDGLRDIYGDIDLVNVLKNYHALVRADVLPLFNKPLGDNAVVGCAQSRVLELEIRLNHLAFETTDLGLLGEDDFLARDGPLL